MKFMSSFLDTSGRLFFRPDRILLRERLGALSEPTVDVT